MRNKKYIIGVDEVGRAASKRRASPKYIIGVDEVGRGPLAGPVTVCALLVAANSKFKTHNSKLPLRDSKKLTEGQREEWFRWIKQEKKKGVVRYALASVSPGRIDRMNISAAANLAAARAIKRVLNTSGAHPKHVNIFLDGGLYPKLTTDDQRSTTAGLRMKTIIKGDEKIPAISLASIAAKVTRDRYMVRLAKRFPKYGFEAHKGYGTAAHRRAIKKHGLSPHHRLTFTGK